MRNKFYFTFIVLLLCTNLVMKASLSCLPGSFQKEKINSVGIIDYVPDGRDCIFKYNVSEISQTYFGISEKRNIYSLDYVVNGEKIYVMDFVPSAPFGTFIEGTLTDEGFSIDFPQPIASGTGENGKPVTLYLDICEYSQVLDDIGQSFDTYTIASENVSKKVEFKKNDSGDYEIYINGSGNFSQTDLPQYIIGVVESNDGINFNWDGVGISDVTLEEFTQKATTIPEGIEVSQWSYRTQDNTFGSVDIAIDNNTIYIQGLALIFPTSCIIGKIEGNKATFEFPQFVGNRDYKFFNLYGEQKIGYNYSTVSQITMEFDENHQYLIMPEDQLFSFAIETAGKDPDMETRLYQYRGIILHEQGETVLENKPEDPVIEYYDVYDAYLVGGSFNIEMMPFDTEGYLLPLDKLYYTIYINGELYTFDTTTYPGLTADMTEIPYTFGDMFNIYYFGSLHQIYIKDVVIGEFGIKLHYRTSDDNVLSSELVNVYTEFNDIDTIEPDEIMRTEYYSIDGYRVSNPKKGIYIKKVYDTKNNVKTSKIIF